MYGVLNEINDDDDEPGGARFLYQEPQAVKFHPMENPLK